jgi:hypothetical protein
MIPGEIPFAVRKLLPETGQVLIMKNSNRKRIKVSIS